MKPKEKMLDLTMKNLAGQDQDLSQYAGRVVLIVNLASECGYTPQYQGLQELHEKYAASGLAILGFPSNDFGAQEPGSDEQIGQFCRKNYGVEFPMFSRVAIKGDDKSALYQNLTSDPKFGGEVAWNFEKFLLGRDGQIAARFASGVTPDSAQMTNAIEAELAKN